MTLTILCPLKSSNGHGILIATSESENEWIHKFLWKSEDCGDTGNGIGVEGSQ